MRRINFETKTGVKLMFRTFLAALALSLMHPIAAHAQQYNWSGLYFGGHVGGVQSDVDYTTFTPISGAVERRNPSIGSAVGGGHIGIQHQWGSWVGGAELSLSGGPNWEDKGPSQVTANRMRRVDVKDLFMATTRLGYAIDRSLLYVKGGYANSQIDITNSVASTGALTAESSRREHGWTIGAGFEYAWLSNVVLGLEYDFVHLSGSGRGSTFAPGIFPTDAYGIDVDHHLVTARLSFLFNREDSRSTPMK